LGSALETSLPSSLIRHLELETKCADPFLPGFVSGMTFVGVCGLRSLKLLASDEDPEVDSVDIGHFLGRQKGLRRVYLSIYSPGGCLKVLNLRVWLGWVRRLGVDGTSFQ
jgi:hypothetical protein